MLVPVPSKNDNLRRRMNNSRELNQDDSKEQAFYVDAAQYWSQVPPTGRNNKSGINDLELVNDTLCSWWNAWWTLPDFWYWSQRFSALFEFHLSGNIVDFCLYSYSYLNDLFQLVECPGKERALDGGAGIGRVTQGFLMRNFPIVDLVEQDKQFLDEARKNLASTNHRGQFFNLGLLFFFYNL